MDLNRLCRLLAGVSCLALLGADGLRLRKHTDGKVYTRATRFRIPFRAEGDALARIQAVELYVSHDRGLSWKAYTRLPADAEGLVFASPRQGEYWFATKVVDNQGQLVGRDLIGTDPGLIVVIDTSPPHVELMSAPGRAGHAGVQWHVSDDHLVGSSVCVEYRPPGGGPWVPLAVVPGQSQAYWMAAGKDPIEVRATARDLAGNYTAARILARAVPSRLGAQDNARQEQPDRSSPTAAAPPQRPRGARSQPARRAVTETGSDMAVKLPPETHVLGSRKLDVRYEIEDVGPSGLSVVELWCTTDAGRTWQRAVEDTDKVSPVCFVAPAEGLYGLAMTVKSGIGRGDTAPATGSTPQLWVLVDTTPPLVRLQSVTPGGKAGNAHLQIRWTAFDNYLADQPIALEYSSDQGQTWNPIVKQSANAGNYTWRLPPEAGYRVMVRVTATDRAGNQTVETMREPVVIDASRPKGRLLSISPVASVRPAPVPARVEPAKPSVSLAPTAPPAKKADAAPPDPPTERTAPPKVARPVGPSSQAPTTAPADGSLVKAKEENRRGTYYRLRGDYERAQKHLEASVRLWPTYAAAHNDLAGVYFIRGNYADAEKHYRRAIELADQDPTPHFGLARVFLQRQDYLNAERELTTVTKRDPEDIEALVLLGQVYIYLFRQSHKTPHKEKALWCWQQVVKSGDANSIHVVQAKRSLRTYQ